MEKKYYTDERNVQIVISLLKQHGIKRVIASPGTTNLTFVASIQQDPWFEIYSSVDERSAAYMACGMAAESGEPVVISCTGATASRNYMPGLTEAFYRKLPVIAITSHQGTHRIGHLVAQQIDRRNPPADIAVESVTVPVVKDNADERFCEIEVNKALLALKQHGGGPVHINLFTTYSRDYSVVQLPEAHLIRRYSQNDRLPELTNDERIAVFIGSHKPFSEEETKALDNFCAANDAVVLCDHTSNYNGKYAVFPALFFRQNHHTTELSKVRILIHVGEVSGNYYGLLVKPQEVWRISLDGELRDTFGKLSKVFEMPEEVFFRSYSKGGNNKDSYLKACQKEYEDTYHMIPELPFGNIWIAKYLSSRIPSGANLHLGILNTLRSWNFFPVNKGVSCNSNVGGFGIDGIMSSLLGASLANPSKLFFGILGDLAFFYDLNSLGNRHVGNNLRIMLINNGRGTEFRNYNHPGSNFGDAADPFIAAAGHFGFKSKKLVKHLSEDLGFQYLTASTKEDFLQAIPIFIQDKLSEKPILFEVFTDSEDESHALETILNLYPVENTQQNDLKNKAKDFLGDKGVQLIRRIIRH